MSRINVTEKSMDRGALLQRNKPGMGSERWAGGQRRGGALVQINI